MFDDKQEIKKLPGGERQISWKKEKKEKEKEKN